MVSNLCSLSTSLCQHNLQVAQLTITALAALDMCTIQQGQVVHTTNHLLTVQAISHTGRNMTRQAAVCVC